jgi:hypothetical protein
MVSGAAVSNRSGAAVLDRWSARRIQPIVVLYVAAVFAAFMVLAHFVFHSPEAVKALLIAAVGGIAATVPGVIEKVEYQLTDSGLGKRPLKGKKPSQCKDVFRWDELSRVVPTKHGFKYHKTMNETNSIRRFWKAHISDQYSGEVHAEKDDLDRVLGIVERQRDATPASN